MSYGNWKPYVPVAERRKKAAAKVQQAKKSGQQLEPIVLAKQTIAATFWGKSWCHHLETYSDFENRLPRGRSYVRNGSVIDLKIEPGKVLAQVMGSRLYRTAIAITPLPATSWQQLVKECTGSIASLVELLQGKFSQAVMANLCASKTGLFPQPQEIRFECSCPDWAQMCKHVAAVLYGIGARLDERPELLFVLRQVDAQELLMAQAVDLPTQTRRPARTKVLEEDALADVFGIEMAQPLTTVATVAIRPVKKAGAKAKSKSKKAAVAVGSVVEKKEPATPRGRRARAVPPDLPVPDEMPKSAAKGTTKGTTKGAVAPPATKAKKVAKAKTVTAAMVATAKKPATTKPRVPSATPSPTTKPTAAASRKSARKPASRHKPVS